MSSGRSLVGISILRARGGSSLNQAINQAQTQVFSAHAEVVPPNTPPGIVTGCILRARGGSSFTMFRVDLYSSYSPRTRR